MMIFLYGEDTYRSRQKLEELRAKFLRDIDTSGLNLTVFDGEKAEIGEVQSAVQAMPFLAKKRMVIVKNLLVSAKKNDSQALKSLLASVPEETILIIHENAGTAKLGKQETFESIKSGKYYPEFAPLAAKEIGKWVEEEAGRLGAKFAKGAMSRYLETAGNDLWKISSELSKMSAWAGAHGGIIDEAAVVELTDGKIEADIFDLLDAIGSRRGARAAQLFERLLDQGESEIPIVNRLQSHIKNMLACAELGARGAVTKEVVSRELGVHPYVASKALSQSRYFTLEELKSLYLRLIDADIGLKTGGWPTPRLSIDLLLLENEKSA
jgi:DNA polymerase-3 subunit delta